MIKCSTFINVPKVLRLYILIKGHLSLQLVIAIGFLVKLESKVKQIDWLIQVVVFLKGN